MTSGKGKAVRADYTRAEADEPHRLVWRQELAATPFERLLAEAATEITLSPDGRRHARPDQLGAAPAWLGALRSVPAPGRRAAAGAGRARRARAAVRRGDALDVRWWGWGEDEHAGALPDAADAFLRRGDRRRARRVAPAPGPGGAAAARPVARAAGAREALLAALGGTGLREDREARVEHAAGRSYPDLVRLRSGEGLSAPDAVLAPGSADAGEGRARGLRPRARGGRAVRRRHERGGRGGAGAATGFAGVVSLDLRGLDQARWTWTASRSPPRWRAACSDPRRRRGSASRGSRSATSRSPSSSRPSAAGWPPDRPARRPRATGGSTTWWRVCG